MWSGRECESGGGGGVEEKGEEVKEVVVDELRRKKRRISVRYECGKRRWMRERKKKDVEDGIHMNKRGEAEVEENEWDVGRREDGKNMEVV